MSRENIRLTICKILDLLFLSFKENVYILLANCWNLRKKFRLKNILNSIYKGVKVQINAKK